MRYQVGNIVRTKEIPKILGYVVDVVFIPHTNRYIPKIFFEDSDEPEWCYKEEYEIIEFLSDIEYMKFIYNSWRDENVSSD